MRELRWYSRGLALGSKPLERRHCSAAGLTLVLWLHPHQRTDRDRLLSLSYTTIQSRTLHPFIPMDQPRAGGKDTSANELHIPNHSALAQNSRLHFCEGSVLSHCKSIRGHFISLDLQNSPRMLRLLFIQTQRGGMMGQEGAEAHGSWQV